MASVAQRIIKLLLAAAVACGIFAALLHHTEASADASHHDSHCELCIAYEALSNGATPTATALVVATFLAVVSSVQLTAYQEIYLDTAHLRLHSALDPPAL